ncbi:hypothetical protein [Corticicoccus populi]|uniref:Uncharacterized protein n=1 Tax=Corticicoccus populi TaxID=1812821 RepID=A0ABW5WU88_9STAP
MSRLDRKNNLFKSNRFDQKRLIPEEEHKPIRIDAESLYSKHIPEAEFTNFLNKSNKSDFEKGMVDFTNNPDRIFEYTNGDESDDLEEELQEILKICYPDKSPDDFEFIMKTRWRSLLDDPSAFRLYFALNLEGDCYNLILVDPLHLCIPSAIQRREKTYINNKSNNICISESVRYIKESLFIKSKNILREVSLD